MALAIALKNAGMNDFIMLERASDIGGVWRDNTYPGAACDVVSRFYSFSYDQTYKWSTAFAPQQEIWDYQLKVVDRHGIRPHVRFNTEVLKATFDDASGTWTVETASRGAADDASPRLGGGAVQPRQHSEHSRPRQLQRCELSIPRTGITISRSREKTWP